MRTLLEVFNYFLPKIRGADIIRGRTLLEVLRYTGIFIQHQNFKEKLNPFQGRFIKFWYVKLMTFEEREALAASAFKV